MRILIDTNVFIGREDDSVVPPDIQELVRLLAILKVEVLIHPKSVDEINNDSNEKRKNIILSKIAAYPLLESPPDPTPDDTFLNQMGKSDNPHDKIDNSMLYAVYKDSVSYLVTEDKKLHKKAARISHADRVLYCRDAKELFGTHIPKEKIEHPLALGYTPLHNIDLSDPFFDSLKKEYPDFTKWFRKIAQEGRKAYVHYEKGKISALLIFKDENESIPCNPPLSEHRRLKLCTFKSEASGNKLGELFIKLAVRYCVENDIDEMYLTHFSKKTKEPFVKLLQEYGFQIVGRKTNGENVYLKQLIPDSKSRASLSATELGERFYPSFFDGRTIQKFIVPIRPQYHDRLFDDYAMRGPAAIYDYRGGSSQFIVEGNTISKAYLCNAHIRKIEEDDLLLFYRSQDWQQITTLGVVESADPMTEPKEIAYKVRNRTVYSLKEIQDMPKPTLVILFRWHFYLPKAVKLDKLIEMGVLSRAPQSISTIKHDAYVRIKEESKLYGSYTVD